MIKDTDEQPNEEVHVVRSGRLVSTGASVPMELGCTPPVCAYVHQPRSSLTLCFGDFRRHHHVGMTHHLTPFPAPLALWRIGGGAESPKLLIMASSL